MIFDTHFALYKPYGFLSQFTCIHAKKKLISHLASFPEGTMAIGRLDEDSEGLLLLTNRGLMSELVRSAGVEKEYYVQVDGIVSEAALSELISGVEIGYDGSKHLVSAKSARMLEPAPDLPARAKKIRDDRHGPTSWISVVLTEGKNRQVRKMTAAVGFPTLRLVRVRIGIVELAGLNPGEHRRLTKEEVSSFGFISAEQ